MALAVAGPDRPPPRAVPPREILQAMRESRSYDLTATTNGARFQSEVLRRLARTRSEQDPEQAALFIGHREWFEAYLERTGLSAGAAPAFIRLAHDHGQDMVVDYRRDRVVTAVDPGPLPGLAINVCIWWPETRGGPDKYSYEDLLATPQLKVTNERVLSYRLLDFGDMVVFGDIRGLRGRPTSGVLGFLFRLIGEGRVAENRMAISADGLQICRARAEKDLAPGRTDLTGVEARLKQPLKLTHPPFECGRTP